MHNLLSLFLIILLSSVRLFSQKVLQVEKRGSFKVDRFYEGDPFSFQMASLKGVWIDDYIMQIDITNDLLRLENRDISISSIIAIRPVYKQKFLNATLPSILIGSSYTVFLAGVTAATFSDWENAALAAGIGLGNQLIGRALLKFQRRKTKIGKRYSLRLIDLSF